jgi:hypothetical protein
MKRPLLLVITVLSIVAILAFKSTNEIKRDYASVNQVSGLYVFLESKPLAEYEVLGTVKKTGLVWNGKAKEMQNILIRRAQDDYPKCDGIIFDDISMEHATVIKFK